MDSTSEFRIKPSHHPYDSHPGQQFYSFNEPIQISSSAQQQFRTFVKQLSPTKDNYEKEQRQIQNTNTNLLFSQWNNKGNNQDQKSEHKLWRKSNGKSYGDVTKYGSLQKQNSESCSNRSQSSLQKTKKQLSNNINRVSLLQSSLKYEQETSNKVGKNGSGSQIVSNLSNKLINTGSLNLSSISSSRLAQKFSQIAQSNKSNQLKKSQSQVQIKINAPKQYRIQGPDEVFAQLQLQKDQKKQKQRLSKVVANKINSTKAMLNQISLKNTNNKTQIKQIQQQLPKYQQTKSPKKFQPLISACLFRLPAINTFPTLPINPTMSFTQFEQNFYHKYKYQLTQSQLIINNFYTIKFVDITKIKIIHNQYNRPELKINYKMEDAGGYNDFRVSKNSQVSTISTKGEKNGVVSELVVFLCDCYETVYMIYSWIVVSKLKNGVGKDFSQIRSSTIRINHNMSFQHEVSGIFLKKSKFLKNWDRRYGKISNFALKSYRITPKSPDKQAAKRQQIIPPSIDQMSRYTISTQCTFQVDRIKQLWTRFQILQQKYLIMKMFKKNKMQKFQIAIPIGNYCQWNSKGNWMLGLVGLLKSQS